MTDTRTPRPYRTAVVGHGYWGKNIARVVSQSSDFSLHTICDAEPSTLRAAQKQYPATRLCANINDIGDGVDVVAVVTPANSHFELGMRFLRQGKHVLVTKPFARTYDEAQSMVDFARERGLTVFVDHTFVFNPAVRKLKELLPRIGKPYFVMSSRMNLGLYQDDVNVIYDLMPHDLSIISYLFGAGIRSAQNFSCRAAGAPREDLAHATFELDNGIYGMITASWLSPFKIRRFIVVGSEGMLSYDDTEVTEKVKFYDRGVSLQSLPSAGSPDSYTSRISYRSGDLYSPAVPNYEALAFELQELKRAIEDAAVRAYYEKLNLDTMRSLSAVLRPTDLAYRGPTLERSFS